MFYCESSIWYKKWQQSIAIVGEHCISIISKHNTEESLRYWRGKYNSLCDYMDTYACFEGIHNYRSLILCAVIKKFPLLIPIAHYLFNVNNWVSESLCLVYYLSTWTKSNLIFLIRFRSNMELMKWFFIK